MSAPRDSGGRHQRANEGLRGVSAAVSVRSYNRGPEQEQQRWEDVQRKRAGNVMWLEDGRISLAKLSAMLTSGIHTELAGSEDAFIRLLDHEWNNFSARPPGTRGSFLVCSAPGRANAKRLRELAGADSLVETLHRRKGEILCSFASLDAATAALVAADGVGGGGDDAEDGEGGGHGRRHGTFSLEPLPQFAKLSPLVAAEPSPAALLLSSEAAVWATEREAARDDEGPGTAGEVSDGGGSGGRRLRAGEKKPDEKRRLSAEHRARVLTDAAAADRSTTRGLIKDGERGMVDAIEISLVGHHERRSKNETEELARGWLSLATDQPALAQTLRAEHFWAKLPGLSQDGEEGAERRDGADGITEEEGGSRRGLLPEEAGVLPPVVDEQRAEMAGDRAREVAAHEERKRLGWAGLLDAVDRGRGNPAGISGDEEGASAASAAVESVGSCRFDRARFTVSPSGKKVLLHRPHEMAAAAAAAGGGIKGGGGGGDDGCLSALLAFISLQPEVRYVTARRKSVTMNLDAAWVSQSGIDGFTPLWDENLQGQDEIIGVADTGLDMNHCQFREDDGDNIEPSDWEDPITDLSKRKVVQYINFVDDFDEEGGHGTHVAGTIAGARSGEDAGDDEGDGMAFQGKLAVFDFGDSDNSNVLSTPDEVDEVMLQPAYDGGARVHSNSWDTVSVEYTSLSKEMDEFVYTHQDLLVVFSAGNCGDTGDPTDNCTVLDEDEGTVLSPAQGKNVVAVGASQSAGVSGKDPETVWYSSSKGPTIDGRIKPDVVAPGDPNWSASADPTGETCEFGSQRGTSMATPVVAGNGAMVRQYFREGWYNGAKNLTQGFDPSAALLKAVLINSATAMSFVGADPDSSAPDVTLNEPPDIHQGFGRVNMINALNINATVGLFFKDWVEIREGETLEYEVSLDEDADLDKDLRVTLVWTDPPASVGSTSALLHDLDLVVIAQSSGTEYYPNGGDGADSVNNVEKVVITDTTEGETYTIRVICDDLSEHDSQNFAVIANGEFTKTNAVPTTPDPSEWLDLVDEPSDPSFAWQFGAAVLALGLVLCGAVACACRRFNRGRKHRLAVSKYRRKFTANRGGAPAPGRKLHPHSSSPPRLRPELKASGSGRFQDPESGSDGVRRMRSMRSEHSARGALLTGAGAVVPGQISTGTQEACPECGLRLPDDAQLLKHVETRHGGRATRKRETATAAAPEFGHAPGTAAAGPKAVKATSSERPGSNGMPAATPDPSGDVPRWMGTPHADAVAAAASDARAKSSALSSPRSTSTASRSLGRHERLPRLFVHKRDGRGDGRGEEDTRDSSSTASGDSTASSDSFADGAAPKCLPVGVTTNVSDGSDSTSSGSGSGSPSPRETSERILADMGKPSTGDGGESGRGQGRDWREREAAAPGHEPSGRRLPKEDPARSLTRTSSLDRMSALSSGVIGRLTSQKAGDENTGENAVVGGIAVAIAGAGGGAGGAAAHEAARAELLTSRRRMLRRSATVGDGEAAQEVVRAELLMALRRTRRSATFADGAAAHEAVGGMATAGAGGGAADGAPAHEALFARLISRSRMLRRSDTVGDGAAAHEAARAELLISLRCIRRSATFADGATAHEAVGGTATAGAGGGADGAPAHEAVQRTKPTLGRRILRRSATIADDGAAAHEAARVEPRVSRRRIRRSASTEDFVPPAHRLSAERLRALGSGLREGFKLPPSVFSPVKPSAKEPAYSPVARERAGELDNKRPVSLTRKFFRQLSGDA